VKEYKKASERDSVREREREGARMHARTYTGQERATGKDLKMEEEREDARKRGRERA